MAYMDLPPDFISEVAELKRNGVKSSSAHEVVARSRGYKTYAAYLALNNIRRLSKEKKDV